MTTPQTPAERPLPASSRCRGNGDQKWLACPRKADSPELQALKQEKEALLRVGGGQTQLDLNPVDQGRREGESESLTGARTESPVGPGAGAVGLRWPERLCPARGVCARTRLGEGGARLRCPVQLGWGAGSGLPSPQLASPQQQQPRSGARPLPRPTPTAAAKRLEPHPPPETAFCRSSALEPLVSHFHIYPHGAGGWG